MAAYYETRLYRIWGAMKTRCQNPNASGYENYGGRGIKVCDDWQEYWPFHDWAVTNGYADDLSLDRIDVNGNYEPANCRWPTRVVQANNTRTNRFITFNGKTMTSREWDRELGFRSGTISDRLNTLGWDVERALTEPPGEFSKTRRYTCNGETLTLSEWAKKAGVSFSVMWKRVEVQKMPIEEAVGIVPVGKKNILVFNGQAKPIKVWAEELGVPMDTIWKRVYKSGWSVEKALTTPVRHYNRHSA